MSVKKSIAKATSSHTLFIKIHRLQRILLLLVIVKLNIFVVVVVLSFKILCIKVKQVH